MTQLGAAIAPHIPVVVGLALGTLAKYGVALDEGASIRRHQVVGHLMMLGFLGLLAEIVADAAHLAPYLRALAGATVALLAAKAVKRYRQWAERDLDRRLPLDSKDPAA